MLDLNGVCLGKRQAELNNNVNEAVKNKINFEDIQCLEEKCDVDKLYKIDIALKIKNIDYLQDVLICGDSLYISRVLKHDCIYDDEFMAIIQPDHLHTEVFPLMSLRMKKKLLDGVASKVRNQSRLKDFLNYCLINNMPNLAYKFSLFLSESAKLDILNNNFQIVQSHENYQMFIGNSFDLADAFLSKLFSVSQGVIIKLSDLFLNDAEKYLDLLEKSFQPYSNARFGARISRSIMTNYKHRVLGNPLNYIHTLHVKVLVHYSTCEDAKKYIIDLLPETVEEFWRKNLYSSYKYIFDIIPKSELYHFYKSAFVNKYNTDFFEMNVQFYHFNYFELLTDEERETCALKHIEAGKELLGQNKDYIWYKFVNYDRALPAIKKFILVTNDKDMRNNMCKILVHSARNQRHLENLFIYYYDRHVNEAGNLKEEFVETVADNINIMEFDEACWMAFNKILYSLEVYTPGFYGRDKYREFSLIYHIINNIDMPEALTYYILHNINLNSIEKYRKKLTDENWFLIYEKIFKIYYNDIIFTNEQRQSGDVKQINEQMLVKVSQFLEILEFYKKTKDDIPKPILDFIQSNIKHYEHTQFFRKEQKNEVRVTESYLMRLLKTDKKLLVDEKSKILKAMDNHSLRLTRIVKKLKIYFYNDMIVQDFIYFFQNCLDKATKDYSYYSIIKTAVCSLFQLADEDYKVKLMSKYMPVEAKIDHKNIKRDLLSIQEAICRHAGYSRPPVPLSSVLKYIKGDYIHFCLPIFNMYLANLPLPQSMQFTEAVLNSPVSIQKHGIRLAFKMYDTETLGKLISKTWQKSKNVSLRMILYKALFAKIEDSGAEDQLKLFEMLKTFTKELHEDDQDEVYDLIKSNKTPQHLRGIYLQTAWEPIKMLSSKKSTNMNRKVMIVKTIERNIGTINKQFMRTEIIDEFIKKMLDGNGLAHTYNSQEHELNNALWELTKTYIFFVRNESELSDSRDLLKNIIDSCFKSWDSLHGDIYIMRKFLCTFLNNIKNKCCDGDDEIINQKHTVSLLEPCLARFQEFCPLHEAYLLILRLRLTIATRTVLSNGGVGLEGTAKLFVAEIVPILEDMHSQNTFCRIFYSNISHSVSECISIISSHLDVKHVSEIFRVHVCIELLGLNKTASVLALSLISVSPSLDRTRELTNHFLDKLKNINDFEIQSYYYEKFFASTFQRGYLLEFEEDMN